jgi:hypothetical protein
VIADQIHFLRRHLGATDAQGKAAPAGEPAAVTAD